MLLHLRRVRLGDPHLLRFAFTFAKVRLGDAHLLRLPLLIPKALPGGEGWEGLLKHLFGIDAVVGEFLEFGNDIGTVLRVGHAEPFAGGVEHLASGGAVVD